MDIIDIIKQQGVLPLFFHKDEKVCISVVSALYHAGVKAIEFTNRGETAFQNFKILVHFRNESFPDLKLGIGTIKNVDQAKAFREIGADFIISPGFVPEVAAYCVQDDVVYAPGCMTPTEIIAAENAGIKLIKLFPGNVLKPVFLSSIREIFPNLHFMPTGGVDANKESIKSWFDAGVCAVGMGSKLISKDLLQTENYNQIQKDTKEVMDIINSIR